MRGDFLAHLEFLEIQRKEFLGQWDPRDLREPLVETACLDGQDFLVSLDVAYKLGICSMKIILLFRNSWTEGRPWWRLSRLQTRRAWFQG